MTVLNVSNIPQVRSLRVKEQQVFLDSDNLTDLRQLLVHIADSDCVALLYTAVRSSAVYFLDRRCCGCLVGVPLKPLPSIAGRHVAAMVPP